uniref:Uncharacterized protein n=1 Tax=Equus asinus TaxID=9793 RepID=A0A8C4LSF8_EQUAS
TLKESTYNSASWCLGKTFHLLGCPVQYCCIAPCAFEYVRGIVVYSGHSMGFTIQNSDIIFAENLTQHFYGIQRGDTVITKSPIVYMETKILTNCPPDFFKTSIYSFHLIIVSCSSEFIIATETIHLPIKYLLFKKIKEHPQI